MSNSIIKGEMNTLTDDFNGMAKRDRGKSNNMGRLSIRGRNGYGETLLDLGS